MAWYYYSGKVAIPIQVKKGVSISVRPGRKFEALENTEQLENLKQRRLVTSTTPDKKAVPVESMVVPELKVRDTVAPSKFASIFVDISKNKPVEEVKEIVQQPVNSNPIEKTAEELEETTKEIEPEAPLGEDDNGKVGKRRRKSGALSTETNDNG
jgi:hypothetical protein